MSSRRFPPPWTVVENAESFWVQDAGGQTVGWPGCRSCGGWPGLRASGWF
jgi:hypothetical protein